MKKRFIIVGLMLAWNSIAIAGELPVDKTENISADNPGTSSDISVNKTVLTEHVPTSDDMTHKESTTPSEIRESTPKNNSNMANTPVFEMSMPDKKDHSKQQAYEIQMSYLHGKFFDYRKIDRYDVDILEQFKE